MTSIQEHSSDDQVRPGVSTVPNVEGGASAFGIGPGADGTQGGVGLPRPVNPSTPHTTLGSAGASAPQKLNEAGNLDDVETLFNNSVKRGITASPPLPPEYRLLGRCAA